MSEMPIHKYRPFPAINLPDRQWPTRVIDKAPAWCSRSAYCASPPDPPARNRPKLLVQSVVRAHPPRLCLTAYSATSLFYPEGFSSFRIEGVR